MSFADFFRGKKDKPAEPEVIAIEHPSIDFSALWAEPEPPSANIVIFVAGANLLLTVILVVAKLFGH